MRDQHSFRIPPWALVAGIILLLPCFRAARAGEATPSGEAGDGQAVEAGPEEGEAPVGEADGNGERKPAPGKPGAKAEPEVVYLPFASPPPQKSRKKSLFFVEPRAIGYRFILERVRVGDGGARGTKIEPEADLEMENALLLSPEINTQINYEILGYLTRLRFNYTSVTLHGLAKLGRDLAFGSETFTAGTVVGSVFSQRRVSLRLVQEVFKSDAVEVDVGLGADYLYFYNLLHAPGIARESDTTETGLPVAETEWRFLPLAWGVIHARLGGFYWNLGRETGFAGVLAFSTGVSVFFTKSWGFTIEFSVNWISMGKGRHDRTLVNYWEFGPGLALYASL